MANEDSGPRVVLPSREREKQHERMVSLASESRDVSSRVTDKTLTLQMPETPSRTRTGHSDNSAASWMESWATVKTRNQQ